MQRERVEDHYPWTWEIPLAIVCAIVVVGVAVCQLGRSLANWFAGAGWRWPTPGRLVTSLPGVLGGDASSGLFGVQHVASPTVLWAWLVGIAVLTLTVSTLAGGWTWRRLGPSRMRGMATVAEAHELLGQDRLWKVRHVVRPDLYPASRKATR